MADPGENVQVWSPTASTNANSDTLINWAEGQPRASVNNSARSMMAALAKDRNLQNGSIVTTGTANAQAFVSGLGYTVAPIPTGLRVLLKIGTGLTNTGPATLDMDGIGAAPIKSQFGLALTGSELLADGYVEFRYDGTNWILLQDTGTGWIFKGRQTASGSTGIVFTDLSSVFSHYVFLISGLFPSTLNATLRFAVSTNNGTTFVESAYYDSVAYHGSALMGSGTPPLISVNSAALIGQITGALDNGLPTTPCDAIVHLYGSARPQIPQLTSVSVQYHNTYGLGWMDSRNMVSTTNINAIIFECFPGNIASGTFSAYGVK